MKNKKTAYGNRTPLKRITALFLASAMILGITVFSQTIPVSAAVNKALQMKVSFNGKTTGEAAWSIFQACYKSKIKLSKNATITQTLYIPKKALSKKNSEVNISAYVDLLPSKKSGYVGHIQSKYSLTLRRNAKKIEISGWNLETGRQDSSKVRKCTKLTSYNSKYYKVTFAFPLQKKMTNPKGKMVSINYKNKYRLLHGVSVAGRGAKANNVYLYADNFIIKSGSKTLDRITFNKKDYDFIETSYKFKSKPYRLTTIK